MNGGSFVLAKKIGTFDCIISFPTSPDRIKGFIV